MTSIEQSTPREVRAAIREQFAKMPANADHNGMSDLDRQATAAAHWSTDPVTDPVTDPGRSSTPGRPLPDQSQGYQGMPTPRPLTPAERIRRQLTKHDN